MTKNQEKMTIGGQAVIEGVMMKSPNFYSVAVKDKNGKVQEKYEKLKPVPKIFKMFFFRGILNLVNILILGIKTLIWSSNQALDEDEKFGTKEVVGMLALSLLLGLAFFVLLPYVITNLIGLKEESNPILFNMVDGVVKIIFFVCYIWAISLMKDVKRLFEYHGAEHKTIFCYENGKELTVKNVKDYSTLHPRCGTSFIFLVFIISIFLFSIIPTIIIHFNPNFIKLAFMQRKLILFSLRILVIPIIAGISYEVLKLSARFKENIFAKVIIRPGLWLQKITTREPDEQQMEIAIISFKRVLELEKELAQTSVCETQK